jgi:hypothetical protein
MSDATKRNPRVLLILTGLLLCSNLATALVAYLVIDGMDQRYSNQLNSAVPGLHEVVLLAQDSTNTHRAAANILIARNESESKLMMERLAEARRKELERITEVFTKGPPAAGDPMEPLWNSSRDYDRALDEFLGIYSSGNRDAALAYRLDKLRPVFDLYQSRQVAESARLNFEAMKTGGEITQQVKSRQSLLLGFGSWPLVIIIAVLVVFGLLGAVLWRQLQRIESEESKLRTSRDF